MHDSPLCPSAIITRFWHHPSLIFITVAALGTNVVNNMILVPGSMEPLPSLILGLGPSCADDLKNTTWVEIPRHYINHAIIHRSISYRNKCKCLCKHSRSKYSINSLLPPRHSVSDGIMEGHQPKTLGTDPRHSLFLNDV